MESEIEALVYDSGAEIETSVSAPRTQAICPTTNFVSVGSISTSLRPRKNSTHPRNVSSVLLVFLRPLCSTCGSKYRFLNSYRALGHTYRMIRKE